MYDVTVCIRVMLGELQLNRHIIGLDQYMKD
jgi:hypothetical protein